MGERYGRSPDIYMPFPIDHERLGAQRMQKLQKQIDKMEEEQRQRQHLIEELARMSETKKKKEQDRLLVKYDKRNLLTDEMRRVYGDETASKLGKVALEPKLVNNVVSQRTKEYAERQQQMSLEAKYLVKERQRLQEARERVQEQRRLLAQSSSPSVMSEPDMHRADPEVKDSSRLSLHTPSFNIDAYIKQTVNTLPQTMDRIVRLREDVQKHYNKYKKPYKGEMGIHTYYPWQMQDYFSVRAIVDDVVNDFLDKYVGPSEPMVEKDTYFASRRQKIHDTEIMAESLSEKKAIQLIMEEIVLDETAEMMEDIVKEHVHTKGTVLNWADMMAMNRAEATAIDNEEGRDEEDPAYSSVTRLFFSLKQNREETRSDIWGHSQMLNLSENQPPPTAKKKPPPPKGKEKKPPKSRQKTPASKPPTRQTVPGTAVSTLPADPSIPLLHYHQIIPVDIRNYHVLKTDLPDVKLEKVKYMKYMRKELLYWQKMVPVITERKLARRCKGISCAAVSPNGIFVALGTVHGDCVVLYTHTRPWRPIRVIVNDSSIDDAIVKMSWSLDSSRLITINKLGSLQIWSYSGTAPSSEGRKLGISPDNHDMLPSHFDILISLSMGRGDFSFQQGPHAEQQTIDGNHGPSDASFFPTFTFFGDQSQACIALDNGDILKSNFDIPLNAPPEKADYEYEEAPVILNQVIKDSRIKGNRIGNGLEAELLRFHKCKLLFLGFMNNINDLVTMDEEGFIGIWKYEEKHIAGVGWIAPVKKFQLAPYKVMYYPADNNPPKLVFTDKTDVPNQRKRTRQEIAQQREMVANTIDNMMLGDPWDVELMENRTIRSSVYIPSGKIRESGAIFHIVMRHVKDNSLSSYVTRVYKPTEIPYTKIIGAKQTVRGDALVILVLFKSYPPKEPHLSILMFDYSSLELRDFRRDVYLSEGEYSELLEEGNTVSFDISKVFGPTGSEHLFILVRGVVRVISLTTGRLMVKQEDLSERFTNFQGCAIDYTDLDLPNNAECVTVSTLNQMFGVFFDDKSTTYHVMTFDDTNREEDRREMWETYLQISQHRRVPIELRVDTYIHEHDDLHVHPAVISRGIVLECMDKALQTSVGKKFSPKMIDGLKIFDKIQNYQTLQELVEEEELL